LINADLAREEIQQRRQVKSVLISILQNRGLDMENSGEIKNILKAVLLILAASPAFAVLINLEDLWLETRPQNIPGTQLTQNWSQKAHYSLEEFSRSAEIKDTLSEISLVRKGGSI
jgi:4-alpha-glucanotransferase